MQGESGKIVDFTGGCVKLMNRPMQETWLQKRPSEGLVNPDVRGHLRETPKTLNAAYQRALNLEAVINVEIPPPWC